MGLSAKGTVSKDRVMGAFLGAAIGDAMGGPVECQHAARIRKVYGPIMSLLPYRCPPGLIELKPGYALTDAPGSVTDDTFIRMDFARFFLEHSEPFTPAVLSNWLLEKADFDFWWPVAVETLRKIQRGEAAPEESGLTQAQGGGNGWWTPVGILWAGNPVKAAEITRNLSRIWKAPIEQRLNSAIQAGLAAALADGADVDSIIAAMLGACERDECELLERAAECGRAARNFEDLVARIYRGFLFEVPVEASGVEDFRRVDPVDYVDGFYASSYFVEQVSIEVACLAYSRGDIAAIPNTVMVGRDCDSTATTVGSWVGALHGESGLPREWVRQVLDANAELIDIRSMGERLFHRLVDRQGGRSTDNCL